MIEKKEAKVQKKHSGQRIDLICVDLFPDLSRKKIKTIIDKGGAYKNKKRVKFAKDSAYEGDLLSLFWDEKTAFKPTQHSLEKSNILYKDSNIVVVNKPAGLASQAQLHSKEESVLAALNAMDGEEFPLDRLHLVHRLDKDTSGVLLIARHKKAQNYFEEQFASRKVEKEYLALVFQIPQKDCDEIKFAIRKDSSRPNAYLAVSKNTKMGQGIKSAHTFYEVVERFASVKASLIKCKPFTGRTHQIRVHMAAIGCPIIGDKTYAAAVLGHPASYKATRQMLHASSLKLQLLNGEQKSFHCPLADDFENCLTSLRLLNGEKKNVQNQGSE